MVELSFVGHFKVRTMLKRGLLTPSWQVVAMKEEKEKGEIFERFNGQGQVQSEVISYSKTSIYQGR
jgi:hypothetical protein